MKRYIETMKTKGEEQKRKVAVILAGVTTLVIIIISLVLSQMLPENESQQELEQTQGEQQLQEFWIQAEEGFSDITETFGESSQAIVEPINEQLLLEQQQEAQMETMETEVSTEAQ